MKEVKRNKKFIAIIIAVIVLLVLSTTSFVLISNNKTKDINIDEVLETKEYSYLPKQAKNYIRQVYEETGEVLLTEKNKEENVPYLNPSYIEYLTLSEEEQEQEGNVPLPFIVDYQNTQSTENGELPKHYNLTNVDGKKYVPEQLRNQGDLGLCWAFASVGALESHLLKVNDESYNVNSQLISERQIDYATSIDGIRDYKSEYVSFKDRELGDGGNFYISTIAMANGISLVDYNGFKPYNDKDFETMELSEVLNYNDSLYEVDSTINMPTLNVRESTGNLTEEQLKERQNYINEVKQNIMKYGAAYVGTYAQSGCTYNDSKLNNTVIDVYNCSKQGAHAMQIIGWDDDAEYTYCADTLIHKEDTTNCNNVVNGKGMWILKNSWGANTPYPYLTYDSLNSSIHFIKQLSSNGRRRWDNNYIIGDGKTYVNQKEYLLSDTKIKNEEELKKIKFITVSSGGTYNVKIVKKDGTFKEYSESTDLPGLVSFYISSDIIDKDSKIIISSDDGTFIDRVTFITSDVEEIPYISLEKYDNMEISEHSLRLYSDTKGIWSDEEITYKLYDEQNNDVSDGISYENNTVAENNVNTLMSFLPTLKTGKYKLEALYNSEVINSITITYKKMEGEGTESNPYVITNAVQLDQIREDLDAYYVLGNDIDLTKATREGGKFYNEAGLELGGHGWEPIIDFKGTLDGNGHTIKGLYQKNYLKNDIGWSRRYNVGGLFGTAFHNASIKNIVLEDFEIFCHGECGTLLGSYVYSDDQNDKNEYIANFSNIIIKNSNIGYDGDGNKNSYIGGVFGNFSGFSSGKVNISNIFSDTNIEKIGFGRVGALLNNIFSIEEVNIKNIQLSGNIEGKYDDGSDSGLMAYEISGNKINIENIISTIYNDKIGANLSRYVWIHSSNNEKGYFSAKNINMVKIPNRSLITNKPISSSNQEVIFENINLYDKNTELEKLTDKSNYSTWENFDNDWFMEPVNGIPRIPILKTRIKDFEFTNIDDISIKQKLNEHKNIYEYIKPNIDAAKRISYKSNNEEIVKIDENGVIIPQSTGNTTIHIESYYDGYIKDVPINIEYVPHYKISFDANSGEGFMDSVEVSVDDNYKLTKNLFTKSMYEFNGWNTKADGTGKSYDDLDEIKALGDKEEITLYAQWIGEEFDIYFDPKGGTVTPTTKKVRYAETYGELPIPVRDGYGFRSWSIIKTSSSYYDIYPTSNVYYSEERRTLSASWKANSYTIVFNTNGATGYINHTYAGFGQDKTLPSNTYTREGYTFVGWNTKADGSGTNYTDASIINLTEVENSLLTLYAQWRIDKLEITFNSNDGLNKTIVQNVTFEDNEKLTKNTFEKEGYIFNGWNTAQDGTGTDYSDEELVSKLSDTDGDKITLYAKWTPITYEIKFDSNVGVGEMENQNVNYDAKNLLSLNLFTKEGYKFKEWNTAQDGTGTSYVEGQEILNLTTKDKDIITLYAQWTPINYSVVFYSNDESVSTLKQDLTYDKEEILIKNTFVREGYIFKEWNTMPDETGTSYADEDKIKNLTSNEEEISLFAIWIPITYKVEFYGNGSIGTMEAQEFTYDVGESFLTKNTFTKEGYIFKEWNTKADGTGTSYFDEASIFNMTTVNNDAIKLYAQWTPITYYIEYNDNATSGNMEIQTLTYDKESNLLENKFKKQGYTFSGWNTKADGTGTSYVDKQSVVNLTNINGEIITLYAQWIANNYQLKFDGNTGNGTMENQTLVYDKESTLIKNVYEKEGYIFNGWNTSTDGLGTSYTDEQSVINLTNINNEVITLYAIWTPITYEIKFDANTGIGTMQNQTLTYDESQPLQLNSYEKEGYVFKYWNTEKDGTGTKYSDGLEIINLTDKNNDVITLYAIWRVDTLFEIEEYVIEDDKYINKIAPNTLRDDFLEKIYVDNKYEVKVFNRNNTELLEDEYVYTGSITKIMQGDTVIEEFTNIILGDVNGDGQISISDVSKIHSHVEKTSIMIEDYYLNAADANRNADITVSDTSKVFSYVEKVITDLWR